MASRTSASAVLYVADLCGGPLRVGVDQAFGKLGLEYDYAERMAEHVMQVARDALALRDGGECEVLLLRGQQQLLGTALLREKDVATADDDHDEDADQGVRPADVKIAVGHTHGEVVALAKYEQSKQQKQRENPAQRNDAEGNERRRVDEEAGSAGVPRKGHHPQNERERNHPVAEGATLIARAHVEIEDPEEGGEDRQRTEPKHQARFQQWSQEQEAGVGEPYPCPVGVAGGARDGVCGAHGRFQMQCTRFSYEFCSSRRKAIHAMPSISSVKPNSPNQ